MSGAFSPMGNDMFGEPIKQETSGVLAERFLFPPFSVLNAREGAWQERKAAWIRLGIKSELGRGGNMLGLSEECEEYRTKSGDYNHAAPGGSAMPSTTYSRDGARGSGSGSGSGRAIAGTEKDGTGLTFNGASGSLPAARAVTTENPIGGSPREVGTADWMQEHGKTGGDTGTSIFDPVLCELAYIWFCPAGGQIIDPFAGGSVRGIVAHKLGFKYWGCDLSAGQIEANRSQGTTLCPGNEPSWCAGDSTVMLSDAPQADFVFSCPPYGDLEVYSEDPRDLSQMNHAGFVQAYREIIRLSVGRLKPNRFACFVVGDYRDPKTGYYRNFVGETIRAFMDAGCGLYNEAILLTMVGSLPIRASGQFKASRKLGKTHQNILVFCKGDGKKAAQAIEGAMQ